ncbi:MAG: radical SAM protein [Planctomycetota bacterium]|nr:radical SAM protein [Planctomycetota bacterium]
MIFAPTDSQKVFLHPERLATWLRDGRSFPVTIELDATNACNHACTFCCWSVLHDQHRDTMSAELLSRIIDDLASVGVKGVIWTGGGEPLLNKHTPAAMGRAQAAGMRNALFTNGALLTPELARDLVYRCDWIRFSIAAGRRADYQRIQGVDDFDKVRRNIEMIVDIARRENATIRLGAMMLLHKSSLATFLPFVEMCRDLGLSFAQGKPSNNYDHEARSTYILERNVSLRRRAGDVDAAIDNSTSEYDPEWWKSEAWPLLHQARELSTPTFSVVTSQYVETKYGEGDDSVEEHHDCDVNNFTTAVTASGNVVWCKNYRDRPEYVLGNLREQTMEEIWASPRRAEVQRSIDSRACARFCQSKKLARLLRSVRHQDPALNPDFL